MRDMNLCHHPDRKFPKFLTNFIGPIPGDCPLSDAENKIIQILIGPDNSIWQNTLIGLGSDGNVYSVQNGKWALDIKEAICE
jgi:hypothetical protein